MSGRCFRVFSKTLHVGWLEKTSDQESEALVCTNKAKLILAALLLLIFACSNTGTGKNDRRMQVVVSIFPLYDFATMVGGNKATVKMIIPPGTCAGDYELTKRDIEEAVRADVFLFVSFEMEQWAYKIINAAAEKTNMLAVETGRGAFLLPVLLPGMSQEDFTSLPSDEGLKEGVGYDPHIWLDFQNAQTMVENIKESFINKDPKNAKHYKRNARRCKLRLAKLDEKYKSKLSACATRTVLYAGNWPFAYQAQRYGLSYLPAYDISTGEEPSAVEMLNLIRQIRKQKFKHIYYGDQPVPQIVESIAEETGAVLLRLSDGQAIGREDIGSDITFVGLMESNLEKLKIGMVCY